MKCKPMFLLLPLLVLLTAIARAQNINGVGPSLPEWFVVVLGFVLPFVFQRFICRLPVWLKPLVAYGLSGAIAVLAGFVFYRWTLPDFLNNLVWLWATIQFVYDILVRGLTNLASEARAKRKMLGARGVHGNKGN